jgi:hypothetical protein
MDLRLDEQEVRVLVQALRNYLPELRSEVYHTDNYSWRQDLKADEANLKSLLRRLEEVPVAEK